MSAEIQRVRVFAGSVDSVSSAFQGLRAPATLTLIEREREIECRFVFFVDVPLPLTMRVSKSAGTTIDGVARDPRGWDVSFSAELKGGTVAGSFDQPHDRGMFWLQEV